ncbi:hypothetical protein JCM11641_006422, partial [Rhodosporidiobolus odoratus]
QCSSLPAGHPTITMEDHDSIHGLVNNDPPTANLSSSAQASTFPADSSSRPPTCASASSRPPSQPLPPSLALDPSLSALDGSFFPCTFPAACSSVPGETRVAVAGPGPSALAGRSAAYYSPVLADAGDRVTLSPLSIGESSASRLREEDQHSGTSLTCADQQHLTGVLSANSGGGQEGKNEDKGKGKEVMVDDIPVDSDSDHSSTASSSRRKDQRRMRSESTGSREEFGADGEDDQEDGREISTTPLPESIKGKKRKSRGIPIARRIRDAGGLSAVAGKRLKIKAIGGNRGVVLPLLPKLSGANRTGGGADSSSPDDEDATTVKTEKEWLRTELRKVQDPAFSVDLLSGMAAHQTFYDQAYKELEQELIKAQIEESVLNNVKSLVVERRDEIRRREKAKAGGKAI